MDPAREVNSATSIDTVADGHAKLRSDPGTCGNEAFSNWISSLQGRVLYGGSQAGWTPLHGSSSNGHVEIINLLIDHASDKIGYVYRQDNHRRTALHLAAANGKADSVSALLKRGARWEEVDKFGANALHYACLMGHVAVVRVLLTSIPDSSTSIQLDKRNNASSASLGTPLMQALLNSTDVEGLTPLHMATSQGHVDLVKLLVTEYLAPVNAVDHAGRTPLWIAAACGNMSLTLWLLTNGASDDARDILKITPSPTAEMVANEWSGWNPLHIACQEGHLAVVEVLLKRGGSLVDRPKVGPVCILRADMGMSV